MTGRIAPERMTCWDVAAAGRYPYTGRLGILGAEDREKVVRGARARPCRGLADRDFTCISDGQRQRVLLARAICQQPRVAHPRRADLVSRHPLQARTADHFERSGARAQCRCRAVAARARPRAENLRPRHSAWRTARSPGSVTPEEVFTDGSVQRLYGLTAGSYDERFGSLELEPVRGAPQALVIGGGRQRHCALPRASAARHPLRRRRAARERHGFPVARALACEIVSEQPYQPIGDAAQSRVRALMHACRCVYAPLRTFGPMNEGNRLLIAEAAENAGWSLQFHQKSRTRLEQTAPLC